MSEPLRLALAGGGPGSFIGSVHRRAAELDGRMKLVAGVFSRDPERSLAAARLYGVAPDRAYSDHRDMIAREAGRKDGIQIVAVATPNASHYAIASAALASGLHVLSDKPMTATFAEARRLADETAACSVSYGLTYTYSGYQMVREARALVASGRIGRVRRIVVEYPQGWLSRPVEQEGNAQASWRVDPSIAGRGGCIGDIGVHAFHLAEFVSGNRVSSLCADLGYFGPGRVLDDDCSMLLRFDGGAHGLLWASQIATGELNDLRLRVYGEAGSLEWSHANATRLRLKDIDGSVHLIHAGTDAVSPAVRPMGRLPGGHPEGFIEAFGSIYRDFADMIAGKLPAADCLVPDAGEGLRSMAFVECALASHQRRQWVDLAMDGWA